MSASRRSPSRAAPAARRARGVTVQQRAILQVVRAARDHPTAADIHRRVRRTLPRIGRATVYRTLARLAADGIVAIVRLRGRHARYDGIAEPHDHLVCARCARIVDVAVARPRAFGRAVARRHDFQLAEHRVELVGVCGACRGRGHLTSRRTEWART
jgi:Fur family ferric uptake transcriptional regulator/Fur family peroxide stress response transcriptional regulator